MIFSSTFYVPSRMGAIYPSRSLTENIPHFKSLEEWQSRKSTKIDTWARMCRHLLSRNDAPEMIFKDGEVIFADVPQPTFGENLSQDRKILIYQEFPSLGSPLRDVRDLLTTSITCCSNHTGPCAIYYSPFIHGWSDVLRLSHEKCVPIYQRPVYPTPNFLFCRLKRPQPFQGDYYNTSCTQLFHNLLILF